jgi:pyrimidine operon attenuation protein/uracil phosphoribosyltransferase
MLSLGAPVFAFSPMPNQAVPNKKLILTAAQIQAALEDIAKQIMARNPDSRTVALVGVQRGGVNLARRLAKLLEAYWQHPVPVGSVDVAMHRDDLDQRAAPPVHPTVIPFDLNDKTVVLVDDVLFSGRTIRAALDAMNDFGRPRQVQLAVLVDRGYRELPIQADYKGADYVAERNQRIDVRLTEDCGEDAVYLEQA